MRLHSAQPGLVKSASRSPSESSNHPASALGSPSGGPSPSISSAPRGALRRSAASTTVAAASAAVSTSGSRGPSPSSGSAAHAQDEQCRAPRRGAREPPAGAEAPAGRALVALRERDDLRDEEHGQHDRRRVRRARDPGREAGGQRRLDGHERRERRRRQPSRHPVGRQCDHRARAVGGLEGGGGEQHRPDRQPRHDRAHGGGNIASGPELR